MRITEVVGYEEFQCIADACPDTCCAGWLIEIDEESLERYRAEKSAYAEELQSKIDWEDHSFLQKEDGRCAFLRDDNLCQMYRSLGEESLCKTCTMYPRHIEEFENVREYSLAISCPEVAKKLMQQQDKIRWVTREVESEEEFFEDFSNLLYDKLCLVRTEMISLLQNRELPIDLRSFSMMQVVYDMQMRLDEGCWDTCDQNLAYLLSPQSMEERKIRLDQLLGQKGGRMQLMQELFRNLYELEPLQEAWGLWLPKAEALLYHNSDMAYEEWRTEFAAYMESEDFLQDQNMSLAIMQEHLVVYFLFSYFCGAVYDEYVYALAQEAVVNAWLIQDLWMAKWLEQGKTLSLEDVIHITYQYSRELEHSDDNLVCMEELMDQNPIVESWYN